MKPEALGPDDLARLILNDPDSGEYLVHRDVFRDERIFELEMKYIFECTWVYLGHESQIPLPNDYLSTWIGRTPVIVWRNGAGKLAAFINSCPHKGSRLCHLQAGNAKQLVCGYHGWTFDSSGQNILVKDEAQGSYAEPFKRLDHGMVPVRFGNYRGFLFGNLAADACTLDEHLDSIKPLIDLVVDQGLGKGMEILPGWSKYTYDANWKMQIENCVDAYHLTSAHPSFVNIVTRRKRGESKNRQVKSIDLNLIMQATGGAYTFPRGHAVGWGENSLEHERPLYEVKPQLVEKYGQLRADWMLYTRNLTIYPNVQLAENAAFQVRVIRPLAVNKTEMSIFAIGPVGESASAREIRIRQYEDFFNSSGMATPDDTVSYEDCQAGYAAPTTDWLQGYARGSRQVVQGPDELARKLGISPQTSVVAKASVQDETVYHGAYRAWMQFLGEGLKSER